MRNSLLAIAVAAILPLFAANSAGAAELRLYGGGHFQGSGKTVAEAFTKKTSIAATYTPGNTGRGGMARRLKAGEQIDVIVMTTDDMQTQGTARLIRADSVVQIGRDGMGIAVLKGATKPVSKGDCAPRCLPPNPLASRIPIRPIIPASSFIRS